MPWVHAAAGVTMGPLVSMWVCHGHCQVCTGSVAGVCVCVHACACMHTCIRLSVCLCVYVIISFIDMSLLLWLPVHQN